MNQISPTMKWHLFLLVSVWGSSATTVHVEPPMTTIDVEAEFGITFGGISRAMEKATNVIDGGDSCTVFFGPGVHSIDM